MMMKLLPFVAAAAAEKRFLSTAGKARVDATNNNILFDTVVNADDGQTAATDAFNMGKGAVYIGGKDTASSVTGLTTGHVYQLAKPAGSDLDAKWKKQARNTKSKDGTSQVAITAATLPDCTNKFIEHKDNSGALKEGTEINATGTSGAKDADLLLAMVNSSSGFADNDKAYLACSNKADRKKPKMLTCGAVYTLTGYDSGNFKLKAKGATAAMKVPAHEAADHSTNNTWTEMFFVKVASDTPKILNVCTAKASASRMAAFVSGLIAYALLI